MGDIIALLKEQIFSPQFIPVILLLVGIALGAIKYFQINLLKSAEKVSASVLMNLLKRDSERQRKQIQSERIGIKQNKYLKTYRTLLRGVIDSFRIPVSVENFTTFFILFWLTLTFVITWVWESVVLSLMISTPAVVALFAFILVLSKGRIEARDNAVMSFLDIICPLISGSKGVKVTIREHLESSDPIIKDHLQEFVNKTMVLNMDFNDCIDELCEKLGPRFYAFADKARVYEYYERDGMAESFMSIIEDNKYHRTLVMRNSEMYSKKNFEMFGRIGVILVLDIYANFYGITAEFMQGTYVGKITNALTILVCLSIFAVSQMVQLGIKIHDDYREV